MRFHLATAGGNDFIVLARLDEDEQAADPGAEVARLACRRRHSLGADGLVALARSERATARFILRNSDGSRAAFSGNGARCAARVLAALGRAPEGRVTLDTDGGVVAARVRARASGEAAVETEVAPPHGVRAGLELPAGSPAPRGDFAVVGVPYLAVEVRDVDALDLAAAGLPLRSWTAFPEGANVAFHEPAPPGAPVRLRTFERGVEGETLSSGTGCVMVAFARLLRAPPPWPDGAVTTRFEPRARTPLSVTLEVKSGAVVRAVLAGDARLVAEGDLLAEALLGPP